MAPGVRSRYPYLSDKDWARYKDKPEKLESVSDFRKDELVDKLANFSLSEKTFNVKIPSHSTAKDELRIVIIGKTGQGKSATANTILGKVSFTEDFTASSVTQESKCVTGLVDGRKISVMDTPGLQDTHQSNESILREIARMTKLFPDGVHAFVYVMNMADPRFTAEDKNVLDLIEKTFGGGFKNYCLLVFSHGDAELKDVDLDTYRKKQMEIGTETIQHPSRNITGEDTGGPRAEQHDQRGLAIFLDEVSWKVLAIDNKTSIPFERNHTRGRIIAMVDQMRKRNHPEIYTNEMFAKAQKEREAMRLKGLKKGWHSSVMSKVEQIIAANPQITRKQLQIEVREQLEEENRQKIILLKKKEEDFEKRKIIEEKRLEEQKRLNEERRQAEEQERRRRQQIEDQERKEMMWEEERNRQERRAREEREWQLKQEQHERERQERAQREEIVRQERLAEEEEMQRKRLQKERQEWEERQREDHEEFERCRQRQQEMREIELREDQQRRQEEEDKMIRREEVEMRRMKQLEREDLEREERRQLEEMEWSERSAQIMQEESERQMMMAEADRERRDCQEREREQRELRQLQEREEWERERDEIERCREEKLEKDEMERQQRQERDDIEREIRLEKEEAEREEADMERERRAEQELSYLRQEIENNDRIQHDRRLDDQVSEIKDEHSNLFELAVGAVVGVAKGIAGWFKSLF